MRESGDSPVWKSLAVAFGDGLAFGVGMKLTQNARRPAALPSTTGSGAILDRLEHLEDRMRRIESAPGVTDPNVLEAVTAALDARLREHVSQIERRVAEVEAHILMETKALEQQDRTLAARMEQDLATLKGQVIALNREFADQVGRIVAEQVEAQVHERTAELKNSIRANAIDAADDAVQERLAPMRLEVARKDQEIADLRRHMAATDSTVLDFILAMGEMCRQVAERFGPPAAPGPQTAPPPAESGAPATTPDDPPADPGADLRAHFDQPAESQVPSFSQLRKPAGYLRMPMVSSVVVTIAGLAMLHYL